MGDVGKQEHMAMDEGPRGEEGPGAKRRNAGGAVEDEEEEDALRPRVRRAPSTCAVDSPGEAKAAVFCEGFRSFACRWPTVPAFGSAAGDGKVLYVFRFAKPLGDL